jgi:hypothetical protein
LCKLGNKSEKFKAVSWALNGGHSNKKVADKGLLIAFCHHIIVVTLELCSCVLTHSRLNHYSYTNTPNQHSRKNKASFTALPQTSLLAVGTNSIICTGITGLYPAVNRSEHQADQRNVYCSVKNA